MLLILAAIAFLVAIISSMVTMQRRRSARIDGVNNARQVEFPFKTWSVDFPDGTIAKSFSVGEFDNTNVSYVVGTDAWNSDPQIILVGSPGLTSNNVSCR